MDRIVQVVVLEAFIHLIVLAIQGVHVRQAVPVQAAVVVEIKFLEQ